MPATPLPRRCLVTCGSLAGFRPMLEEVLSQRFLQALVDAGFDTLELQCGPDLAWFKGQAKPHPRLAITIEAFSFTHQMREKMLQCRGEAGVRRSGVIIGHAGTGTIMEALRYKCPLIIVPNGQLLDDHQREIANHIAARDLAVVAELGRLHEALAVSRALTEQRNLDSLPPYRDPPFPVCENYRRKILDWTLLTCFPEEIERLVSGGELPRPSNASMDTAVDDLDAYDRGVALDIFRCG